MIRSFAVSCGLMRPLSGLALWGLASLAVPAAAAEPVAQMDRYFSIWADNARVTPDTVGRLYASRVVYYGKPMTRSDVYRDKLSYIHQWPDRHYAVLPGSLAKSCDATQSACRISAVLSWEKADPRRGQASKGANTINLMLVREDGILKIARESGTPVAASACRDAGGRWTCGAYH